MQQYCLFFYAFTEFLWPIYLIILVRMSKLEVSNIATMSKKGENQSSFFLAHSSSPCTQILAWLSIRFSMLPNLTNQYISYSMAIFSANEIRTFFGWFCSTWYTTRWGWLSVVFLKYSMSFDDAWNIWFFDTHFFQGPNMAGLVSLISFQFHYSLLLIAL